MSIEGCKRKIAQKEHSPLGKPQYDHLHGPVITHDIIRPDTVKLDDRGKKKFQQMYSSEKEFRSSRKILDPPIPAEPKEYGKKAIHVKGCDKEQKNVSKRHFDENSMPKAREVSFPCVEWKTKRTVIMSDGIPAYKMIAKEYNMETTMNRKQRVNDIERLRNGIPVSNPGDNYYKEADREPGFYAKGGLVVGSTIAVRKSAKPEIKSTIEFTNTQKKFTMTYAEKQKMLEKDYDVIQVRTLTLPSEKQEQRVPSWEERTGNWLVRPEDENY